MTDPTQTHEVFNQPPPLEDYNVFLTDPVLSEALDREGAGWARPELTELGERAGTRDAIEIGRLANENVPVLHTHDRFGNRLDVVEYHPAYHELMTTAIQNGLHSGPWSRPDPGGHVARAAKAIVWYQVDAGHVCPISMTYAVLPALRHEPDLLETLKPLIFSNTYDPSFAPSETKKGITCGMGLTEKQGGSDVRSNTTSALPLGSGGESRGTSRGREYALTGHKWFCSAPMSDGFLMLANAPNGLSCFWVPRWKPDGTCNEIWIQRLKDKLGDRSNASSEIELLGAYGHMVGEEGHGVRTIIEMVNHTRLDCTLGSTSLMRQALAQATWHAKHRNTFSKLLSDHPLMENVLADMALESQAATAAAMRVARCYDQAENDEAEALLQRILTPVVKYWTCKRAPQFVAEALECTGGNGFVEESPMPRLYRQAPVNGVWEGSGNVICLDVLRAMSRDPRTVDAFTSEVSKAKGGNSTLDAAVADLSAALGSEDDLEPRARRLVEKMALVFQAALLVQHAPSQVSEAFCSSRLGADASTTFGTLDGPSGLGAIIERSVPWWG
ncbi:MAG: acyl-CoA dehydrogenase family protein [Actinobacteria bacterium]|nr:acyl-CoA dehydrogenase family protein [Actinomycetota bacterium]